MAAPLRLAVLASLGAALWAQHAHAADDAPTGRASFAIVEDTGGPSTLDIHPSAAAARAFPKLPADDPPPARNVLASTPPAPPTPTFTPTFAPQWAPTPAPAWRARTPAPVVTVSPADAPRDEGATPGESARHDATDDWMLSLEGATRAPVDVSIQARLEIPAGLRLGGGYGWVPSSYLGFVTGIAAAATNTDSGAGALIDRGYQQGRTWHLVAGIRPFHNTGVYLDAGYAELRLSGSIAASDLAGAPVGGGDYALSTTIRMWTVELGYQAMIADRIVFAVGVGATGAFSSRTTVTATSGAVLPQGPVDAASAQLDDAIGRYCILPTLDARLGFDLI